MGDFKSRYTGEQIDEAVGKALNGGTDGVSPTIDVSKSGKVTTLTIKDANGTETVKINDGADGVSPTHSWSGTTLTISSASGTSSTDLKGEKGDPGDGANVTADSIHDALGYTPMNPDGAFYTRQDVSPDYTNLIDVHGVNPGKHLSSSGELEDNAKTSVSGFIPVKLGDVIRIKDPSQTTITNTSLMFALYKADQATSSGIGKDIGNITGSANNDCGIISIEGNVITWTLEPINYYFWKNFAYARVSSFSADMIVTVNEPLTESVKEQYMLRPTVKVGKDSLDFEPSAKPLAGKTIVGFGDSIFGYIRDSTSVLSHVANETGATVYNVGFGGCRMSVHPTNGYAAFSMWALAKAVVDKDWTTQDAQAASGSSYFAEHLARLKEIDFNTVDIVVIHYGSNDITGGAKIDNASDPDDYNTMCGALRYSIDKLLGAYPHLQIYVDLPTYRYWPDTGVYPDTYTNSRGLYCSDYADALRATAAEYNLPVIDCFYAMGVNKHNVAIMTSDGAHHSLIGRQRLGELIGGYLNSRQASGKGGSGMDTNAVQTMIDNAIGAAIGGSY